MAGAQISQGIELDDLGFAAADRIETRGAGGKIVTQLLIRIH
jgi:hypothetical protein